MKEQLTDSKDTTNLVNAMKQLLSLSVKHKNIALQVSAKPKQLDVTVTIRSDEDVNLDILNELAALAVSDAM